MKLNNYELKKLSALLKDYLELTFNSAVATKIPHRIFAMELLQKMDKEEINETTYRPRRQHQGLQQ